MPSEARMLPGQLNHLWLLLAPSTACAVGLISSPRFSTPRSRPRGPAPSQTAPRFRVRRSEEHTSELQSLMRISYAVFCLKKKTIDIQQTHNNNIIQKLTLT